MRRVIRLLTAAVAVTALGMTGCTRPVKHETATSPCKNPLDAKTCHPESALDCADGNAKQQDNWVVLGNPKACVAVCQSDGDCHALSKFDPSYVGRVCYDAACVMPVCGSNHDCTISQCCLDGQCTSCPTADDVAKCMVLPQNAIVHEGDTTKLSVFAVSPHGQRAAGAAPQGNGLAYQGPVTWSITDTGSTGATIDSTGTLTGGSTTGALTVNATIGKRKCTPANVVNYAKAAAGTARMVVVDAATGKPISGAKVFFGYHGTEDNYLYSAGATTDDDGIGSTFVTPYWKNGDITVMHTGYAVLSLVDVPGTDFVVYLKPAQVGLVNGGMLADDFAGLPDAQGDVHLALVGRAIPGSLADIELDQGFDSLVGNVVPTGMPGLSPDPIPLPEGTMLGRDNYMTKGWYQIRSPLGVRAFWGFGGNTESAKIADALAPILAQGSAKNVNVAALVPTLISLLGPLQSGVYTGVSFDADAGSASTLDDGLKLDQAPRVKNTVELPSLPSATMPDGSTKELKNVIVVGGAAAGSQGVVPLGLAAGSDSSGSDEVDADAPGLEAGELSLPMASRSHGFETSPLFTLALAVDLPPLIGADTDGTIMSGLVAFPGDLSGSPVAPNKIDLTNDGNTSFMDIPQPSLADRTVTFGPAPDGTSFWRVDIGGTNNEGEWTIYLPADQKSYEIPVPYPVEQEPVDSFTDYFLPNGNNADGSANTQNPRLLVEAVSLGAQTGPSDYQSLMQFNSTNMDGLATDVRAFAETEIKR